MNNFIVFSVPDKRKQKSQKGLSRTKNPFQLIIFEQPYIL